MFGTLTSDLALLVNRAFKQYGQPNAYIVGGEGGGAFLAGLRYGEGKLYTKLNDIESGPAPIYWQGPTLGADLGANGAQTLFLVYNLQEQTGLVQALSRLGRLRLCRGRLGNDGLPGRRYADRADPHRARAAAGRQHRLYQIHRAGQPEPVLVSLNRQE